MIVLLVIAATASACAAQLPADLWRDGPVDDRRRRWLVLALVIATGHPVAPQVDQFVPSMVPSSSLLSGLGQTIGASCNCGESEGKKAQHGGVQVGRDLIFRRYL